MVSGRRPSSDTVSNSHDDSERPQVPYMANNLVDCNLEPVEEVASESCISEIKMHKDVLSVMATFESAEFKQRYLEKRSHFLKFSPIKFSEIVDAILV